MSTTTFTIYGSLPCVYIVCLVPIMLYSTPLCHTHCSLILLLL